MSIPGIKKELTTPVSRWQILCACIGAILGVTSVNLAASTGYSLPQILLAFAACYIPAVILHELAHAVAGRAVGGTVDRIKLGLSTSPTGRHWSFRLLGFRWELYVVPLTGIVTVFFSNPHRYRARVIAMIAAGPLASFAAAGVAGVWLCMDPGPKFVSPLLGWIFANGYFFIATAVPSRRVHKGRVIETDGHRIKTALAFTDEEISQRCLTSKVHLELQGFSAEKLSVEEAIVRCESSPDQLSLLAYIVDRLGEAGDPRQTRYIDRLIAAPGATPLAVATFLDGYLTRHLQSGTVTNDESFDRYSKILIDLSGHSTTTLGTRGSVLIDLGRLDEGAAILENVLRETDSPVDKCFAKIFLALVEKKKGNTEAAARLARDAQELDPKCAAMGRVSDLILLG